MNKNDIQASPAQLRYADTLFYGSLIGFVIMLITYVLYVTGILPPQIPLDDLPRLWTGSAADYRAAGSIPQGWVEGLTVAAVACLIYAIVVLIRILCGKYEQEKLPDITFELVDMTPETEAKPETAPEADSVPEAEPEAEAAQPEKSEETEDTPDA